ncbi:50S ribosomal protein L25/general stress protein Ctc [Demequina capsici]|uniref:Large ribosomal subunit protein bL25 n=1 Tax=Demequina capsici TaxID=3075620 RepID=A0AA96J8F7_9MICO|nr:MULTISPECIES: 50S ribosomal protein L25/general stress protein Ctc [unclassified Demequina]WNM25033.1 50S ribosomal protein L25/general stress protein Ctc [Demequina sp. OYTSA14]WNM27939.1 50S ribosomal protein L25/general stress protein Ctc [Demequina sp. PMTSA13]
MSDELKLAAEARTEFGKGFARRARAAGKIPAVIYGHGTDPVHVLLPGHDTMMALKHANALLTIDVAGKSEMVIVKDIQRDAVKRSIDHVDLLLVKKGEKIAVEVPVHVEGETFGSTIHVQELNTLHIQAEATHLPETIVVSVEGLPEGVKIVASEVELPKGVELLTDADALVVHVTQPRSAVAAEDEAGEAGAEAAAE